MSSRLGNAKENRVRDWWAGQGWVAMCGRCSRGPADVICVKDGEQPRLIQVKGDVRSPWENFRPEERLTLVQEAAKAGGVALLAWHPKGARGSEWPKYFTSDKWPSREQA